MGKLTPRKAADVLETIKQYEATAKGDKNRTHFNTIVRQAVSAKVITRDELIEGNFLTREMCSAALRGMPTGALKSTRTHVINEIRQRAQKALPAEEQAVTPTPSPAIGD